MNRRVLENLLLKNVAIVTFRRRTDPKGKIRHKICTKSNQILSSFQGRSLLNFMNPKGVGLKFDPARYNLIVVWDIFMQEYRMIPCESVRVVEKIPAPRFWNYYNQYLKSMSASQKKKFMNK